VILGIETSCDETAAALVTDDGHVRANVVASQTELHAEFGGVVPEIASRRHLELVMPVVREALVQADASLDDAFLKGAEQQGMIQLKGHRSVGGMRASIYNAMPLAGVRQLVAYMKEFEAKHG